MEAYNEIIDTVVFVIVSNKNMLSSLEEKKKMFKKQLYDNAWRRDYVKIEIFTEKLKSPNQPLFR